MTRKQCLDCIARGNHKEVVSFLKKSGVNAECFKDLDEHEIVGKFYQDNNLKLEGKERESYFRKIFGETVKDNPIRDLINVIHEWFD